MNLFKKIILYVFLLVIILGVALYLGYNYTEKEKKDAYIDLKKSIKYILKDKEVYYKTNYAVKGDLRKLTYYDYETGFYKDDEGKNLYEYFTLKSGGFHLFWLKETYDSYKLIEMTSNNMGFKVGEYEKWNDFHNMPTYRGTVQEAYDSTFKFILKKIKGYEYESYNPISDFIRLENRFYKITKQHCEEMLSDGLGVIKDVCHNKTYIYNSHRIVWYDRYASFYKIKFKNDDYEDILNENLLIFEGVGFTIYLVFVFLINMFFKKRNKH